MSQLSEPVVSIVIPAYNVEAYIERSIRCGLAQTVGNVQVVVVDDGSTDGTADVIRALAAEDMRVKTVFLERNAGRLEARRAGIVAADAAFIMFLDADDELLPDAAETLLQAQAGTFDIVQCNFEVRYQLFVTEDERRFNEDFNRPPDTVAYGDDITHLVYRERRTTWSLCGKLMRSYLLKQAIDQVAPGSITQAEDACLFFIVSCLAESYKGLPGYAGYLYNIDCGNSDARWKHMDLAQFSYSCHYVDAMDHIRSFLEKTGRMSAMADDYRTVRYEHVRSVADKMAHAVERELRPQAFDQMIALWPAYEAIAGLSEAAWHDGPDCLESIVGARALVCGPREIRTVGAYHYNMHVGGAERVAAELARLWTDMGLHVVFFADEPRSECAYELPAEVDWVTLPTAADMHRDGYGERAEAIAQAVERYGIDAFVNHQWWSETLIWDSLLLKSLGVPVCVLLHSIYEALFYYAKPADFDCSRVLRHLDGLVVLSEFDKKFWQRFNPRVWQTNNPTTIPPDEARRSPLTGKNVVWVGRLSRFDKQPHEAIEIIARVAAFDPEVTLTMVGPFASKQDRDGLKSLVKRLGVQDIVEFAGTHDDTSGFFRRASVHLLTSRIDGWCLVLAESKSFGLPCVMYDMPYLTLTQGSRGIVAVPQGDRDAAARAVANLLQDDAKRRELGDGAFEHIREVDAFDLRGLWEAVFTELATGSPERTGFELDDAQWNLALNGFKQSVRKASDIPIRDYLAGFGKNLAQRVYRKIRH